ncbi:probable myosin light chain kinase DDB_G0284661 [Monomorium pharaonis]|uniref:probable myosin light chain kinase DDB_G0284661 n=1 Tax=Monomorium pharaonis TaxID=307658 RepID=UPI001745E582|nr:probable myosin light chain kinase DDB_G0284661 [Monomorium pharaonis]
MSFITRLLFGCLVLAISSQYADAEDNPLLENIKASLQRLEGIVSKQAERPTLTCFVPVEKLSNLFSEQQISNNEDQAKSIGISPKALDSYNDIHQPSVPKRHKKKSRSLNDNTNANVNENVNKNVNANRYHRRSLDPHFSNANQNINKNVNSNSNVNRDIFDFSDEYEEV